RRFPIPDSPFPSSAKLAEETRVVLEEAAQIADTVTQHRKALDADAERETGVALRVDATGAQHVRVHHAAAQHLQPALAAVLPVPADIDFGRGLGEGEV